METNIAIKEQDLELVVSEKTLGSYKVKINYITLDEQSGREKKTPAYMLVQASTIDDAKAWLEDGMKGTLSDYVVESIKETKIMDVYPYEAPKGGEA